MSKKRSVAIIILSLALLFLTSFFVSRFQANENDDFTAYTNALFCQEVAGNTITLHYSLKDPSQYGITNAPVTFGQYNTDTASICASCENTLASLRSFDRSKLSSDNQLTYDVLEDYLTLSLEEAPYLLYDEPLSPLTGTQSQLPVLLSEYQFYDRSDVDTYLELLTQLPAYFDSILSFEKAKSKAGLFMADYSADAIIKECQAFVDMEDDNYLYSSFEERLTGDASSLSALTAEEKRSYIETNSAYIEAYIFPAYISLKEGLQDLRGTGKNKAGLCNLPDGTHYYELTVRRQTGSNRTISQLQQLTAQQMNEDLKAIQQALTTLSAGDVSSVSSDIFKTQGAFLEDSQPSAILATLEEQIADTFPQPPKVTTQIKYVQESMEEYLSPAFYMVPAIDNTKNNVIYINQGHLPDDLSLFTTLAHEGYPGHLYQNVYYASLNPDPIRTLLNFGGYTEGWATYCEMLSYYYAPISKEEATLMQRNTSLILGLYALADMGIHYDGWTLLDTVSFFRSYGITDQDTIEDIYEMIIADPANYLKYYIGYVEFLELKKEAIASWGDEFTQKRFHAEVLEAGPAGFDTLKHLIGDGGK